MPFPQGNTSHAPPIRLSFCLVPAEQQDSISSDGSCFFRAKLVQLLILILCRFLRPTRRSQFNSRGLGWGSEHHAPEIWMQGVMGHPLRESSGNMWGSVPIVAWQPPTTLSVGSGQQEESLFSLPQHAGTELEGQTKSKGERTLLGLFHPPWLVLPGLPSPPTWLQPEMQALGPHGTKALGLGA